jgi:hypothetical protein
MQMQTRAEATMDGLNELLECSLTIHRVYIATEIDQPILINVHLDDVNSVAHKIIFTEDKSFDLDAAELLETLLCTILSSHDVIPIMV